MADDKKKTDYFPDFDYRFFPIKFEGKEMEGIQGPVYSPSGEILHLGDEKIVSVEEPQEVFHEGDAGVYELSTGEMDLDNAVKDEILGYVPCPKCAAQIPITSEERPLKIKCPKCGKKGRLD